jgi:hypothetical protein
MGGADDIAPDLVIDRMHDAHSAIRRRADEAVYPLYVADLRNSVQFGGLGFRLHDVADLRYSVQFGGLGFRLHDVADLRYSIQLRVMCLGCS